MPSVAIDRHDLLVQKPAHDLVELAVVELNLAAAFVFVVEDVAAVERWRVFRGFNRAIGQVDFFPPTRQVVGLVIADCQCV